MNGWAFRGQGRSIRSKHGNRKVVAPDGQKFDSQREYTRWNILCLEMQQGAISDLRRQVAYVLAPKVELNGKVKPCLRYVADAVYVRDGKTVVEDSKSPHLRKNPVYRIKKHLMKHVHGIEIQEV